MSCGDASLTDATVDAPTSDGDAQVRPPVGSACVFPTLYGSATPSSGYCNGNVAVACDRTGVMQGTTCSASERCVEFDVTQIGSVPGNPMPYPGFRYRWASCVPRDATPCAYEWSPATGYWTPVAPPDAGAILSRCVNATTVEQCVMPLPATPIFPANAGTETAFYLSNRCTGTDQCADGHCWASLTPCTDGSSHCDGNDVILCTVGERPQRMSCSALGQQCRSSSACSGYPSAGCFAMNDLDAPNLCDPNAAWILGCGPSGGLLMCGGGACFGDTQCRCVPNESSCSDGTTCVPVAGGSFQCGTPVSCGAGSRCEGATAIRCDASGHGVSFDCGAQGMTCEASGGSVGCVLGTATCSPSSPTCGTPTQITACCSSSGVVDTGLSPLPCVPGRRVQMNCPVRGGIHYQCLAGQCSVP